MKRHIPDPDALATALTRRLDTLETRVEQRFGLVEELRSDIAALGRGLADVAAQLQHVSQATNGRILRSAGQPHTNDEVPGARDAGDDEGQRDWLAVTDPDTAAAWLIDVTRFAADVLEPLDAAPTPDCWPLHAGVVVELLALQAEYRAAYDGANPTPISELLTRWLPGATARISSDLTSCAAERAHRTGRRAYEIPQLSSERVAAWWRATHGRGVDAPEAFAMTPIA